MTSIQLDLHVAVGHVSWFEGVIVCYTNGEEIEHRSKKRSEGLPPTFSCLLISSIAKKQTRLSLYATLGRNCPLLGLFGTARLTRCLVLAPKVFLGMLDKTNFVLQFNSSPLTRTELSTSGLFHSLTKYLLPSTNFAYNPHGGIFHFGS